MEGNISQHAQEVDELLRAYVQKYHQDYSPQNEEAKFTKLKRPVNSLNLQAMFSDFLGAEPENILDIGCGTGRFLRGLPISWKKYGLDNRLEVVEIARLMVDENTEICQGVAENLPFEGDKFDVVTSFQVLEHVNDVDLTISEMFRVTKPGGLVYGELPNKRYPKESHINLIYPQLLPLWLRKPYIDYFSKTNQTSEEFDYLRNIHYLTPQEVLAMLQNYANRVIHLTPIRLQQRFLKKENNTLANAIGCFLANFAGIEFVAIK